MTPPRRKRPNADQLATIGARVCRPDDWHALLLHLHGLNRNDIAHAQRCSVRTVHDRIRRALNTIDRHLNQEAA